MKKVKESRCNSSEMFIGVKCNSSRINHITIKGIGGGSVNKHATTNVHETGCLLQVPGKKNTEAEETMHDRWPLHSLSAGKQVTTFAGTLGGSREW